MHITLLTQQLLTSGIKDCKLECVRACLRVGTHTGALHTTREHGRVHGNMAVFPGVHRHLLTTRDHGPCRWPVNMRTQHAC